MNNLSFNWESDSDSLSKNRKECLFELQKRTNFFNIFVTTQQKKIKSFEIK